MNPWAPWRIERRVGGAAKTCEPVEEMFYVGSEAKPGDKNGRLIVSWRVCNDLCYAAGCAVEVRPNVLDVGREFGSNCAKGVWLIHLMIGAAVARARDGGG